MRGLKDKVALITGAAGGIGKMTHIPGAGVVHRDGNVCSGDNASDLVVIDQCQVTARDPRAATYRQITHCINGAPILVWAIAKH